jgi:tyrosyl-tRNA synthetase
VILLIGNGTVRIGDPTGRDSTRPVLTDEQIDENFKDWKKQAEKILDFSKIKVMHNGDWLDKLNYADLIKLMAQTTVQQLIERDMFQDRLKKNLPIFGHEIMYPLMQGYDSVAMNVDLDGTQVATTNLATANQAALGTQWSALAPIILQPNEQRTVRVHWAAGENDYDNSIQSDSVAFDMNFRLIQQVNQQVAN